MIQARETITGPTKDVFLSHDVGRDALFSKAHMEPTSSPLSMSH